MRVLLAAAEIYPFAKTGGMADVCGALPRALQALGAEVRLLLPGYESALDTLRGARLAADLDTVLGVSPVRLLEGKADSGLTVWLLDCPALYRRPGTPYQDEHGADWPDNALRFGVFCHAIARLALGEPRLAWRPQVLHCHDWHTGLAPYLLSYARSERPRTVFTIHNAAFQGCFPLAMAPRLGVSEEVLQPDGIEFYGQLSFLKAALRYADRLTTVSPSYARELLTPEFGCGLEGLIAARAGDFVGILNGIDTDLWNPATDAFIAQRYSAHALDGKAACKADLQKETGLAADPAAPIVAFASRLTAQKMADVTLERLPALLARHPRMQFALVGNGEPSIEAGFKSLARKYAGRMGVRIGYSEAEEHRLHAGADLLLHGARFEPCGLAQMYAMRYGALPVVRRVGGLADTVAEGENGFVFEEADGAAMEQALERGLEHYTGTPDAWRRLQRQAMNDDFGWAPSAREYLQLYGGIAHFSASRSATAPATS
jgi:starch synthase